MTTVLSRADGSSVTYQNTELATIITGLEASNNQHLIASGVAFVRIGTGRLLMLDVDTLHNRKLLETYAIHYDSTFAYNLKFTSSNMDFSLDNALDGVGYSNLTPVASLASMFAALYEVAANQNYLTSSNLVSSLGTFEVAPAQLKTFIGGNGCTIAETADSMTLNVTPVTIIYPPPVYGNSSSTSNALTTFWSGSNHALVFTSPLLGVQTDLGAGTIEGTSYDPMRVTHLTIDQSALDAETNVIVSNALTAYSNTSQIQALIDTSIQNALDNITFSSNFDVDRSTGHALAVSNLSTLFSHIPVTTSVNSQDVFIGSALGLDVANKSWTITLDIKLHPNQWHEVLIYGNSQRNIGPWTNYRIIKFYTQYNTMKLQMNQPSGGQDIAIPTSAVTANDWNVYKLTYNASNYIWTLTVNGVFMGAVTAQAWAVDTIQDILLYETNGQVQTRNVYIYDGIAA